MKKIINGKKYDTDTANYICEWHDYHPGDFNYVSEDLYRKKNGEFFLHGEGGAMSKYSTSCGPNSWCGGEKIIPLTDSEVKEWLEITDNCDEYENLFGEVSE